MRKITRVLPALLPLEDRTCPALTLRVLPGLLDISGVPTGPAGLAITGVGMNLFKVEDGGKFLGNYRINNLSIRTPFYNAPVTLDLEGQRIGGNILINRGNGNLNPVIDTNPIEIRQGSVGGTVTVLNGRGNNTLNLGGTAVADSLSIGGGATVVGRNGAGNGDQFRLRLGSRVGGNLTLVGTPAIALGDAGGTGAMVGGAFTATAFGSNRELSLALLGTTTIGRAVTITGTNVFTVGGDSVTVEATTTVGGNFTANLQNNVNFWALAGNYSGNVSLIGGEGSFPGLPVNLFQLDDGGGNFAQVAGSLSLIAGNADSAVVFTDGATVGGNMSVRFGNGNNDLGDGDFGEFSGAVAGNLTITLGNGDNTALIERAPGGTLFWRSGNGTNTLTLGGEGTPTSFWLVNILFGTGDDTLNLADTAGNTQVLNGRIDFGPGTNTFTQDDDWFLLPTLTIVI